MLVFDEMKCVGCSACVDSCCFSSIVMDKKNKTPYYQESGLCLYCGHCVSVCPRGAITHSRMPAEEFKLSVNTAGAKDVDSLLQTKRSIRCFKDKSISEEDLEEIFKVVRYAPTEVNRQDTGMAVITDRNKINEIEKAIIKGYVAFIDHKVNKEKVSKDDIEIKGTQMVVDIFNEGGNPVFFNAPCVVFAFTSRKNYFPEHNCSIAMNYMSLKAHAMGVGSFISGRAMHMSDILGKILRLEDDKKIGICMCFGYPKYKYNLSVPRKENNIIRI